MIYQILDGLTVINTISAELDFMQSQFPEGNYLEVEHYPEPAVPALSKAQIIKTIKTERDRRKFNGVKVGTQWIHTDTYSRTQWLGMFIMGPNIPAISWATMDGTKITTSQSLASAVFQGVAQLDAQIFGYADTLIVQVTAANDPASVDITNGWPPTYVEAV